MYKYDLKISEVPPPVYAGFFNRTPFYFTLYTDKMELEDYRINLYSQNSRSAPYQQPQNKWSHLVPQWGFFDYNGDFVEFVTTYFKNSDENRFVYEASAYYVDNLPATVNLIATLETSGFWISGDHVEADLPSYSNSLVFDQTQYEILDTQVKSLSVTQNGKNEINNFNWVGIPIPFVVTFHPESSSSLINTNIYGLTSTNPIVFTAPVLGEDSVLNLSLYGIPASSVEWREASSVVVSGYDMYGFHSKGYYKGWVLSQISALATNITVGYSEPFYVSNFLVDDTEGWDARFSTTALWVENGVLRFQDSTGVERQKFRYKRFKNTSSDLSFKIIAKRCCTPSGYLVGSYGYLVVYDEDYVKLKTLYVFHQGPVVMPTTFTEYEIDVSDVPEGYLGFEWYSFGVHGRTFDLSSMVVTTPFDVKENQSNEFQIKPFERPYELRRFNESWDAGETIHSFALAEHTYNNPVFFDNFMEVSVGGLESSYQSLGRSMYEKIANFVKNHSDIDVCNLNQLYSLHDAIDCPIDDYRMSYPTEIRRLMDIFSVNKNRLIGNTCKCNRNFLYGTQECSFCGHSHPLNRGSVGFLSDEYVVTANYPFVVENLYTTNDDFRFDVLYPSVCDLGGLSSAPLSALPSVSWLVSSNYPKYTIYDHVSTYCGVQQEGLINWGDTYTTLSTSISSLDQWYGDNGIVEELLNYEIHKGLYNV